MPWPTNFAPPYLGPDMDYTLFKWLAPTLEYMEGGGKLSPGSQMLVVDVLQRGKNRRSFTCQLHNVAEWSTQNKEPRLYLYPSMLSWVSFVTSTRSRSIKDWLCSDQPRNNAVDRSVASLWHDDVCSTTIDTITQDRLITIATIANTTIKSIMWSICVANNMFLFNQWNNNATERNEDKHFNLLTTLEYDNIRNKPNSEAHNMDWEVN